MYEGIEHFIIRIYIHARTDSLSSSKSFFLKTHCNAAFFLLQILIIDFYL